jgi:hypothetical protein
MWSTLKRLKSVGSGPISILGFLTCFIALPDIFRACEIGIIIERRGQTLERDRQHLIDPLDRPDIQIFLYVIRHFL